MTLKRDQSFPMLSDVLNSQASENSVPLETSLLKSDGTNKPSFKHSKIREDKELKNGTTPESPKITPLEKLSTIRKLQMLENNSVHSVIDFTPI